MSTRFRGFHGRITFRSLGLGVLRGGVECVKFLMLLALVLSLANCGFLSFSKDKGKSYVVKGRRYYILNSAKGFRENGLASWYGEPFHGRKTASGEIYDMDQISAAHKTLPLHTWVEVKNIENKRIMTIRINDRGPFVPGRIIDLSRAAAKQLGIYGPGLAKVHIKAVTGRRAQQLMASERAKQGLAILAQAGPAQEAGRSADGEIRLTLSPPRAPSAGDHEEP